MPGVKDYLVERFGLSPDASHEETVAFIKDQRQKGAITKEHVAEMVLCNALLASEAEGSNGVFLKAFPDDKRCQAAIERIEADHKAHLERVRKSCGIVGWTPKRTEEFLSECKAAYESGLSNGFVGTAQSPTADTTNKSDTTPDHNDNSSISKEQKNMATSASPTPAQVFGGAGQPNVRKASERYSTKRFAATNKHGKPVLKNGITLDLPSDREYALTGAWFKRLAAINCPGSCMLNEHDRELLMELATEHDFVGDAGGTFYPNGVKLTDALRIKAADFIGTSTSGGDSLTPFFFDSDLVTFPLLSGELAPKIDMRDLSTSSSVHTQTLGNPTAAWSGSEGSGSPISLLTTDGLVTSLTSNVFNVAMAITIGRDLLADTPVALGREVTGLMGARLAAEIDKVIAIGDGTTQPKGLTNTSGTHTVTAANSTAGPLTVADIEKMISSLPKQYRLKSDSSVAFVMNDSAWWRIRGIAVSASDQRRIFGYNDEQYTLIDRPVCISNDLPANDMFFGKLALYRMWRRQGLQIEMSTEGKTLRLNNELLITARGRYAGQFVDGAGLSFMSNASLHS